MNRQESIDNIIRIVKILSHPYQELVCDFYIDYQRYDSIEVDGGLFKINIWCDSSELYRMSDEMSNNEIRILLKEMEDLF